jgi:hypothetical protein
MNINDKEKNVRLFVPEQTHDAVKRLQAAFTLKENKKPSIQEAYLRILERGIVELKKQLKI